MNYKNDFRAFRTRLLSTTSYFLRIFMSHELFAMFNISLVFLLIRLIIISVKFCYLFRLSEVSFSNSAKY